MNGEIPEGSPPRVRGKAIGDIWEMASPRITPARAGKRNYSDDSVWNLRDHPRACGEKLSLDSCVQIPVGSPPRVRGKVVTAAGVPGSPGITPARAGKSDLIKNGIAYLEDHPRACGEKASRAPPVSSGTGSPPRVRGKAWFCLPEYNRLRITPARAGKRAWRLWARPCGRDHPRACGEKLIRCLLERQRKGSPPRVRGKGRFAHLVVAVERITPARAGKR